MNTPQIAFIAIGLYAGASISQYQQLRQKKDRLLSVTLFAVLAFLCHIAYTALSIFSAKGIDLGIFHSLTLILCTITAINIVCMYRYDALRPLNLFFYPLAGLSIALSCWLPSSYTPKTWPLGLSIHIVLSICAYGVLSIAALQAVSTALLERALRNRQARQLMQYLPPLQTMEAVLFDILAFGTALLTIAIGSGYFFVEDLFAQHLVHKTLFSIVSWLVFVVLLWGRYQYGWRGKTAVKLTLSGFFILMLAFFGSKFVLELLLERV